MATKKTINPSTAMNETISTLAGNATTAQTEKKPKKVKRVTLCFREQSWTDFMTLAHMKEQSPNDILNDFIERSIESNKELIERHRKTMASIKDVT